MEPLCVRISLAMAAVLTTTTEKLQLQIIEMKGAQTVNETHVSSD